MRAAACRQRRRGCTETPRPEAVGELSKRAANGERILIAGDAVWVHYPNGIGRSKLTNAMIEKTLATRATGRNWNTVLKLAALAAR